MSDAINTNHPFKIFFVSYNYWDTYNFRLDVIKHFIDIGYEVHIAAIKDDFADRILDTGCKVHYIKFNNRGLNPLKDLFFLFRLKKIYRQVQPDLIFHYAIKPNIYGSIVAAQLKIPSVSIITGLGYAFASDNWLSFLVIKLYRYALKNVNLIWMLNEEDKDLFITKRIASPGKINLLQSEGIDTERFKPIDQPRNKSNFTFLMATRMLWSKGVGVFAEASETLQKKGYNFQCVVAGFFEPGHPDTISPEALKAWQAKNLIIYSGFFENIIPLLAAADCFVLPSYYHEGVPRSLLEACAMQLPAITTNNSGCKEVIKNNINGFICSKNNAEDLAAKMEKMLNLTPAQLAEMGRRGREIVLDKFEIQFTIAKYNEAVKNVIRKKGN